MVLGQRSKECLIAQTSLPPHHAVEFYMCVCVHVEYALMLQCIAQGLILSHLASHYDIAQKFYSFTYIKALGIAILIEGKSRTLLHGIA